MASKPRIRIPEKIAAGSVVEIKTLIQHVMETGQRRDASGKVIPRNIIHTFTASFEGKEVFKAEMGPGVAANPYIAFNVKVPASGELVMTWIDDDGEKVVEKVALKVS